MVAIGKYLMTMILALSMQLNIAGSASIGPQSAAEDFIDALAAGNDSVVQQYVDNEYVNLLENVEGEDVSAKMYSALFANLEYETLASAEKNDVAVVKMQIKNKDFSGVQEAYDEAANKYITSNLYSDDVTDKEKLADKCLEIYLDELEAASEGDKTVENTIYLPLVSNGHYGWNVVLNDEIMAALCGELSLPEIQK